MRIVQFVRRLRTDAEGNAALEYGLIAGFISLVIVAGLILASPAVRDIYNGVGSAMSSACSAQNGKACS